MCSIALRADDRQALRDTLKSEAINRLELHFPNSPRDSIPSQNNPKRLRKFSKKPVTKRAQWANGGLVRSVVRATLAEKDLIFSLATIARLWRTATFHRISGANAEHVLINSRPIPGARKQAEGTVRMEDWIGQTYAPKLMVAEAEKFIAENKQHPFFLYLPFIEPHVAMHPPMESVDRFPLEWDAQVYRGESSYLPHPRPRAAYAAMISDLDRYVGRILMALEQAGVSERTLVVFTSDNGTTHAGPPNTKFHIGGVDPDFFNSTAGLRGYKGSVYEGGIRVPMIAKLPGRIAPGSVNDTPSYFADWFPTLCDFAGFAKPKGLDGDSLWPTLTGKQSLTNRKPMVWVFPEYGGQVAVTIGEMKAIRQGLKTKQPGNWEVYNLSSDPTEKKDIAADHRDFLSKVESILQREVDENSVFPLDVLVNKGNK